MLQSHTIEILHDDERLPVLLINFVDRADVGMVQRRGRLRFALKTPQGLRVFGNFVGKELQGDKATELDVFRLVDHTHPTAAELLNDSIVGNDLAEHGIAFSFQWLAISSLLRAES